MRFLSDKNNALQSAIDQTGLDWREFAVFANMHEVTLINILTAEKPAKLSQVKRIVKALADLGVEIDSSVLLVDISCREALSIPISNDRSTFLEDGDKHVIRKAVAALPVRESEILSFRYGLLDGYSRTLSECGRQYGVTMERIRQIEKSAFRKLSHPSRRLIDYCARNTQTEAPPTNHV